jgi:hypothetical protein
MKTLILLFLVLSCSHLSGMKSLEDYNKFELLNSVRLTGEGKARLILGEKTLVLNVDSLISKDFDWILAMSLPLYGEEVLILPDLKNSSRHSEQVSLEKRLDQEARKLKLGTAFQGRLILAQLRDLLRFFHAQDLGLSRQCQVENNEWTCTLDEKNYRIEVQSHELVVTSLENMALPIAVVAKNLTSSNFTNVMIKSEPPQSKNSNVANNFSIEFFW